MKKYGFHKVDEKTVVSYEIVTMSDQSGIEADKEAFSQNPALPALEAIRYGDYTVALYGEKNNLPKMVSSLIRNNAVLPEILKKQVRILYGQGLYLYKEDEDEKTRFRVPVSKLYPKVWEWLSSWKNNGIPPVEEYIKSVIYEYYYLEGYFSKWHFNLSRRINGPMPVRGLERLPGTRCRLATRHILRPGETLENTMLDTILYGRWEFPWRFQQEEFPLFRESDPLKHRVAVNYIADKGFDEDIYSIPTYFYGLYEWIRGSNLNPKYINSYLRNSLNAKVHVLIPDAWIASKENTLRKICQENQEREQAGNDMIAEYEGLTGIGNQFDYSMLQKLINIKIDQVTKVMAGEGENQGKLFVSRKFRTEHGVEEWEFKDIPTKYKEFVESITGFEKQAVSTILAGKGLAPSISNVSKDGIFDSGSAVYYAYLVYLDTLCFPEDIVCRDLNTALAINFPELQRDNVKIGLYHRKPERQSEVPPEKRMDSNQT